MSSFKLHDARVEKTNSISRHGRTQKITTLFRFLELFIFFLIVSRFSTQFSINLSGASFRGITVTLISPRFVFLAGNAIVVVLFLISGRFSPADGGKAVDIYNEYVRRCRSNRRKIRAEERKELGGYKYGVVDGGKKMSRCRFEIIGSVSGRGEDLRRSVSDKCRRSDGERGRTAARMVGGGCSFSEEEMSSEEFRRTVEAFIARQQRFLREEEGFSAAISV